MNLPPCHKESPQYAAWNSRVESLEEAGLDRSDAQGIADLEFNATEIAEKQLAAFGCVLGRAAIVKETNKTEN